MHSFLAGLFLFLTLWPLSPAQAQTDSPSAVVLMYHRFGADTPSTSVKISQFEAHLEELKSGPYTVLPLPDVIEALQNNTPLPERTVAITIDDAYISAYREAWPRLKAAGFPFTVFVATEPVNKGYSNYMNWDHLRELQAQGVTIGSQTKSHLNMATTSKKKVRADLKAAQDRFQAELGEKPDLLAYPYGYASEETIKIVKDMGFAAAFGQHSGAIGPNAEFYYLPRFPLNEKFGDISRFNLIANALPLPVTEITPENPTLSRNPPLFGFTVDRRIRSLRGLSCYSSHEGKTRQEILGHRVEVRMKTPFPTGGSERVNCTMLGPEGRWRWFGRQFYVPADLEPVEKSTE